MSSVIVAVLSMSVCHSKKTQGAAASCVLVIAIQIPCEQEKRKHFAAEALLAG
jgi:hypothetical protein